MCSLECGCNGGCVREPENTQQINQEQQISRIYFHIIALIITNKVHYKVICSRRILVIFVKYRLKPKYRLIFNVLIDYVTLCIGV